jgi:hypothetical protein
MAFLKGQKTMSVGEEKKIKIREDSLTTALLMTSLPKPSPPPACQYIGGKTTFAFLSLSK